MSKCWCSAALEVSGGICQGRGRKDLLAAPDTAGAPAQVKMALRKSPAPFHPSKGERH